MMRYLLCLLLAFGAAAAHSQNHYTQKVFAFVQHSDGGQDKHFIYLQMPNDSLPIWDSAIIDRKKYVVHFSAIEEMPIRAGTRKSDGRLIVVKAMPDTKTWMLVFDETGKTATETTTTAAAVVLTGKFKGRKLTYKILTEIEIE